ncbi:hypothetical protein Mmc1_2141 [Magnetococcus marinus MC-1]|uniref:Dicarboxylate transport domain-containing protein n=1 Tax=Magnetococcus marinus (strain ATCC BAA-1437 / JCM 17883 / MC-1) TaxID=156889 RepID=A0L9J9_MAGMM|nr:hypothetical protein [Magnetococcus marinus]ABK44642.1 hypothetical protein Mmc1_2141 [Magnetococcus marinus MC-1]
MFANPTGMLLRFAYRFMVRMLFAMVIVLSLTIAMLQVDSSRQEVFTRLGTWGGWQLSMEKLSVGLGHLRMLRVNLQTKDGTSFVSDDVVLSWGFLDLLFGRLSHMSMVNPVWHFGLADAKRPGVVGPDAWGRMLQDEVAPPIFWLFALRVNELSIENGEVVHSGQGETGWRMHSVRVFGEHLTQDEGQLVFAGESDPAGVFSGHLRWDDERYVVLHTRDMTAKPWFGLLNIGVTQGVANLDLDLRIKPGKAVSANGQLDLQGVQSVDHWQGATTLFLTMRGGRLHWNGSGQVTSAEGVRKPLLMSGTLFHEREEWNINDGTLKLGGMLDSQMRVRWKKLPEWQVTTELHSPMKLMAWMNIAVPLPEGAKWMQRKPWKITAHGQNTGPNLMWGVEGVSGPDRLQYGEIEAKEIHTTLQARGKANRLLEPIQIKMETQAVDSPYAAMRYVQGSTELVRGEHGGWAMNGFRVGGEVRAQKGRFQSFSWRGDAQGAAQNLHALKSVLHWHDARLEISYSHASTGSRFSDAGWRLEIPETHPLAVSRLTDLSGRALGNGQLHGLLQVWRDHALWKSRATWRLSDYAWLGDTQQLELSDAGHKIALHDVAMGGRLKLIFDPESQGLSVQVEGEVPSGKWSVDGHNHDFAMESPEFNVQIRSEEGWHLHRVPFHMTGSSHQKGVGLLRWDLNHEPDNPWSGEMWVEAGQLGHLYANYLRPVVAKHWPDWQSSEMDGRLDMALQFEDLHQWRNGGLRGEVKLSNGRITGPNHNWRLHGVQLVLPLMAQSPAQPLSIEHSMLEVAQASVGTLRIAPFHGQPRLIQGVVDLQEPLSLQLEQTPLTLHQLQLLGLYGDDLQLQADVEIPSLDLQWWGKKLGVPYVTGTLGGRLSEVRIDHGELSSKGTLHGRLWQGELAVAEPHIYDLFKAAPQWGARVQLRNGDLQQTSEQLQLGKIEGLWHLNLTNLRLQGLTPVRMQADFNGGPQHAQQQRVGAALLRNLAILAGQSDAQIKAGVMSLFDQFRYTRLGGHLKLEEGMYTLTGFQDEYGSGPYLLRGGPYPPRADITLDGETIEARYFAERLQRLTLVTPKKSDQPPQ